jgi:hypothetical protein
MIQTVTAFGNTVADSERFVVRKSLKIPKGLSESVNRRRTDNTHGRPLWNIYVTNDHRCVPLVVSISRSFPYS